MVENKGLWLCKRKKKVKRGVYKGGAFAQRNKKKYSLIIIWITTNIALYV